MLAYEVNGRVGVIRLHSPPVNALGHGLRSSLQQALQKSESDPAVQAVVICSGLSLFSAGADIEEFNTDAVWNSPNLPDLCKLLDSFPKLTVAAINGAAMGGALEIAMACDYRMGAADAIVGLPEIKLGLLPGAGGTQRLPRLVGIKTAAEMILSGEPVGADKAHAESLLDVLADSKTNLEVAAVEYATTLLDQTAPFRNCSDIKVEDLPADAERVIAQVMQNLQKKHRHQKAPEVIAALLNLSCREPLDSGLLAERDGFDKLLETPEAGSLIHLFFAERKVYKVPGVTRETATHEIRKVAVLGGGTMGVGITLSFLDAGFPVTLVDTSTEKVTIALDKVHAHYQRQLDRSKISNEQFDHCKKLLSGGIGYDQLADTDLVIEAVFEDMALKKTVFSELDAVCKSSAILASNTSTLDLNSLASVTSRPQQVVGLHFFSPANIMRLLEVVRGDETSAEVIKSIQSVAGKIRKLPVTVGVCYGFVGNRMLEPYFREASRLMLEGASAEQIDAVLCEFGMAMGVISVGDLAGIDVGFRVREQRRHEFSHDPAYQAVQDHLYQLGRYGQKTGRGCYLYTQNQKGRPEKSSDPELQIICQKIAQQHGIERREITDAEIMERCIFSMINEGLQILDEDIASRPGDIDLIWVNGYGFPATLGGPMRHAEEVGLAVILQRLEYYREQRSAYGDWWFQPAKLLKRAVAERQSIQQVLAAKRTWQE